MAQQWIKEAVQQDKNITITPELDLSSSNTVPESFDFSEEKGTGKEVYAIYGLKGSGKTVCALSFPGTIMALSFDRKTTIVRNNFYNNDERIKIFDGKKYLVENPTQYLQSAEKSYNYIIALLEEVAQKQKPDWILFDCTEIMALICEMVMRKRSNLTPYGGVANRNVWKDRKALMQNIHNKASKYCQKGIIYTLYVKQEEIVREGETITKIDVPKWMGVVMLESDFVLRTKIDYDKEKGKTCSVHVYSSKNDKKLKTGETIDVTDFKNKLFKDSVG